MYLVQNPVDVWQELRRDRGKDAVGNGEKCGRTHSGFGSMGMRKEGWTKMETENPLCYEMKEVVKEKKIIYE